MENGQSHLFKFERTQKKNYLLTIKCMCKRSLALDKMHLNINISHVPIIDLHDTNTTDAVMFLKFHIWQATEMKTFICRQSCHPGLRRLERNEGLRVTTIMVALCSSSSFVSESLVLPALSPASFVFLLFHISACHPLSPLCQPLTSRTVFTCLEAVAMVTRVALFAALALVYLEGEDDVFPVATELAHEAFGLAQHAASYMHGAKFKQLFHAWSKITVTHSSEVIKREEVKVLCQVTWKAVELVPYLFSQAAGLEEIFHVKQLHPQNPDGLQSFDLFIQATVDVTGVEQRVSGDLAQQVPGEVADIVLAEVPLPQHSAGNNGLSVLMAALTEITAEVFAVTQSLYIIWVNAGATASTAVILFGHNYLPLGGGMNIKDDLRSRWRPL